MTDARKLSLPRLLEAAAEKGVHGAAAVARALVVSDQTINHWKTRGVPHAMTVRAQELWGISAQWIASGEGEKWLANTTSTASKSAEQAQPINLENNPDYPAIRRVRFKLSAGLSGYGIDYDSEEDAAPIVFRREWYERNGYRPERLMAVRVINGSMEPGLWDGDTVVVNLDAAEPIDGVVYAVNYEGYLVIKRLVRDAGQWWLVSDHPDQRRYPRKVCDEHAHLIGRIVHKQSERI